MAFGWRRFREHLEDHLELSQYGNKTRPKGGPPFRRKPRERDKGEISMTRGRLEPGQAHRVVGLQAAREDDGVRWTTVGTLRAAGFQAHARPTQGNPNHVTVSLDGGGQWSERHADLFDQCFTEAPQWLDASQKLSEGGMAK
jgi:hypothetical protein